MCKLDRDTPPIVYDAFYESFYFHGRPVTDLTNLIQQLADKGAQRVSIEIVASGAKGAVPVSERVKQHINVALASLQSAYPTATLRAY